LSNHVWSTVGRKYYQVWLKCLIMSDRVWTSFLIMSDHVWSCLIMFDQLSAEILASLIKGFPTTTRTTTTKQNVDPAVHFVYSRVKNVFWKVCFEIVYLLFPLCKQKSFFVSTDFLTFFDLKSWLNKTENQQVCIKFRARLRILNYVTTKKAAGLRPVNSF
jgi:hypothetical protein